ncbi:MAG: EpsG family protein [Bacilli bacterium]
MYLFILFFITFYLYIVDKVNCKNLFSQLILWIPAFLVFFVPMALQNGVGTDYETYKSYFYLPASQLELYEGKGEFIFLKIIEISKFLGDPQYIFVIFSFLISVIFFITIGVYKRENYKPWLFFLIYFIVTGVYHTSMNTLRQSLVSGFFPILIYFIYYNKNLLFFFATFFLSYLHKTSLLYFLVFVLKKIKLSKKIIFIIFLISPIFYYIDQKKIIDLIFNIGFLGGWLSFYRDYIYSDFFDPGTFGMVVAKLYYVPYFIIFWFLYFKNEESNNLFFDFLIKNWVFTCFMIVQVLHISIYYRLWNMFSFLYVFPIYYVLSYYLKRNVFVFGFLLIFLMLPYLLKVTIFSSSEYEYFFYNFIF